MHKVEFEHKFKIGDTVMFTPYRGLWERQEGTVQFIRCVLKKSGMMIEYVIKHDGIVYDVPESRVWETYEKLNFMERFYKGMIPKEEIISTATEVIEEWYKTGDEETRDVHQYMGLTAKEYELLRSDETEFLKRILSKKI